MFLQDYLKKNKITLEQFSERAGISFSTLWKTLHGKELRLSTAQRVVRASDHMVTYDDLVDERLNFLLAHRQKMLDELTRANPSAAPSPPQQ